MALGISVYPRIDSFERDAKYIKDAASFGYERVFICLLSQNLQRDDLIALVKKYSDLVHKYDMKLSVDTNPKTFKLLEASPDELLVFKEMGVDIIRLDADFGFEGNQKIVNNNLGIIIEINASWELPEDTFDKYNYDPSKVYACHNFYPQRYTGLDIETCRNFSNIIKKAGLRLAVFISSQEPDTVGPWPISDGLPTIEVCRDLDVDEQIRLIESFGIFDDVLFGNAYASIQELEKVSIYHKKEKIIKIKFDDKVTQAEKSIVLDNIHTIRLDSNLIMHRSSNTRNAKVLARAYDEDFKSNDLILINDKLEYYMGEFEIIKSELKNDGCRNYLGSLEGIEKEILNNIKRGDTYRVEEK